jgi:ABC-type branched-subunit amino acid transport system ATPase component/ABC-type branched-subunit amino acid transport system permease subunit
MKEFVQFVVLGLGLGSIYGLLSLGIVVVYRGSGVVNFAQGTFALAGAIVFVEARDSFGWVGSLILAVATGVVLGTLTQNLVMRPMARAAPIARVMATLGIFITIMSIGLLKYAAAIATTTQFLPAHGWHLLGVTVQSERAVLLAIGIAVTVALSLLQGHTRVGAAARAAAENELAVATLGWSPNLLATASWAMGGALAGLAGALIVPLTGLVVTNIAFLIVPALAAALLGGFASFYGTFAGALGVGILEALIQRYWTQTGATSAVPFLVIVVVLVVNGRSLPLRGHINEKLSRLGTGEIRLGPALVGVLGGALLMGLVFSTTWVDAFTVSLSTGLIFLSVVVVTGYAGQLSLAQYALAGLGAYFAGRLISGAGFPFWAALIIGVALAVPTGLLFAIPALRTRGVNLAVVTLGLGVSVHAMLFSDVDLTGGFSGTNVTNISLFGFDVGAVGHPERFGLMTLVAFVLGAVMVANLRRSAAGRRLLAIRGNERAAASLGISVVRAKLFAFACASALAALGGIFYSFHTGLVAYDSFAPLMSLNAVAFTVIGGLGYVLGPLLGSAFAQGGVGNLFDPLFHGIDDYLALIGGVAVVLLLIAHPDGSASIMSAQFNWLRRKLPIKSRQARAQRRVQEAMAGADSDAAVRRAAPKVLKVDALTVRFGAVTAVSDVSLSVGPGEIVGLIGPNGAGKTTLIDAVSGFVKPVSGSVALDDQNLLKLKASGRTRAGVARSWQSLELFEDIDVLENLQIAAESSRWDWKQNLRGFVRPGMAFLTPSAQAAVTDFKLVDALDRLPTDLAYSQRRLVGIARAVALGPSILLLDEPAAGLSMYESQELSALLERLAATWGIGILLVEHDVDMVMRVCDRVVVLDFGRKIAEGTPTEVRANPAVVSAYLGVPEGSEAADAVTR